MIMMMDRIKKILNLMANNYIFATEDKYPGWAVNQIFYINNRLGDTRDEDYNIDETTTPAPETENEFQLIIKDDGFFVFYQSNTNNNGELDLVWSIPTIITQTTPEPVVPSSTSSSTTKAPTGSGAASGTSSQDDDLIWLWVILALLIVFVIMYTMIYKYKRGGFENEFLPPPQAQIKTSMVLTSSRNRNDSNSDYQDDDTNNDDADADADDADDADDDE